MVHSIPARCTGYHEIDVTQAETQFQGCEPVRELKIGVPKPVDHEIEQREAAVGHDSVGLSFEVRWR